ncbi:MAG: sortase [Anaerolineae bacterium]|nr:sortase [Anaerolineae bacterium]
MKVYRLLIFAGCALVLAVIVVFLYNAAPLISSRLYTSTIPTAPPLTQFDGERAVEADELTLLPFLSTGTTPQQPQITRQPTSTSTPSAEEPTLSITPALSNTILPTPTLNPTPTPDMGAMPATLRIPVLELEAPVIPIGVKTVSVNGTIARMWDVPGYRAVGWHKTSAPLGLPGNTVLNGHNTLSGEVFRDLYKIPLEALVLVNSADGEIFAYRVKEKYILPEAGQPLEVRLKNALYVEQTADERLTLVTCHPYGSLANRLIVIAVPAEPSPDLGEE